MSTDQTRRLDMKSPYFFIGIAFIIVGLGLPIAASRNVSGVAFTVLGFVFISMAFKRPS